MKYLTPLFFTLLTISLAPGSASAAEDSRLSFSSVHDIDLDDLADGSVKQQRNSMLSFARGVTAQSVFILNAPVATVQNTLETWNPAKHSELQVWLHEPLPASPTAADFSGLANLPDNSSVKSLVDATGNPSSLLLTPAEAAQLEPYKAEDPKTRLVHFWSATLANRAQHFLNGSYHQDAFAYPVADGKLHPLAELKMLLHSDPKIYHQFQPLLAQTPILSENPVTPAKLYYEVFDVEGSAVLGTGALFAQTTGDTVQIVDMEYYESSTVYCTIEMYQLWPVTIQGKAQTLVWRADFASAGNVAFLHGMERMAASMLMLQDVKQAIDVFRSELK